MADDEGRMLGSAEARVRRRIASIAKKDAPKPFLTMERDISYGGVKRADKNIRRSFDKQNPEKGRRYSGIGGTKIRGKIENSVGIEARYKPHKSLVKVLEVYPLASKGKGVPFDAMPEQHKVFANKMLDKPLVKGFVKKASKMFHKATDLVGSRDTGARADAANRLIATAQKTGNLDLMSAAADRADKMKMQHFSLSGVRNRMSKLGKAGKVLGLGLAAYDLVKKFQQE